MAADGEMNWEAVELGPGPAAICTNQTDLSDFICIPRSRVGDRKRQEGASDDFADDLKSPTAAVFRATSP
jgi:hypothetical protein